MHEKDCVRHYKNTLKLLERHMGTDTTDEHQLTEICKNLFGKQYRGTFPVDRLPKLQRGQCCILNLDTSDKPGSHWVAVYKHEHAPPHLRLVRAKKHKNITLTNKTKKIS